MVCLAEANQEDGGEDVDGVACLLNSLAALERASAQHRVLSEDSKHRFLDRLRALRAWLSGREAAFDWAEALPKADIERMIANYKQRPDPIRVEEVVSLLKSKAEIWAASKVKNADSIPTFVFPSSTTTEQLARLLCLAWRRLKDECGRDYVLKESNDEVAVFCYWLEVLEQQGYQRADGTIGLRDLSTNLPMSFGGDFNHPLQASLLAHARHGSSIELVGAPESLNVTLELWMINRFRGSHRTSTLLAVMLHMLPELQKLRNQLVERGIFKHHRILRPPSRRLSALWYRNGMSSVESAIEEPERAVSLRHELERHSSQLRLSRTEDGGCRYCKGTVAEPDADLCSDCQAKSRRLHQADDANALLQRCGSHGRSESPQQSQPCQTTAPKSLFPVTLVSVGAGIVSPQQTASRRAIFERLCVICHSGQTASWCVAPGVVSVSL